MADEGSTATDDLNIPDEVREKFPELIEMVQKSESMNLDERQYWIDVLPIMNEEQTDNLKNILANEKQQIEEADKEYEEGMKEDAKNVMNRFDEFKYKERKRLLFEAEAQHEKEEEAIEEDLLKELETL